MAACCVYPMLGSLQLHHGGRVWRPPQPGGLNRPPRRQAHQYREVLDLRAYAGDWLLCFELDHC